MSEPKPSAKNMMGFVAIVLLYALIGAGLAIAEENNVIQASTAFAFFGAIGVLYFFTGAFVVPYLNLKTDESGFRYIDHLDQRHEARWDEIVEITVFKENRQLEWLIKTRQGAVISVMDNEYLYRRRLRKHAMRSLKGFDDVLLSKT